MALVHLGLDLTLESTSISLLNKRKRDRAHRLAWRQQQQQLVVVSQFALSTRIKQSAIDSRCSRNANVTSSSSSSSMGRDKKLRDLSHLHQCVSLVTRVFPEKTRLNGLVQPQVKMLNFPEGHGCSSIFWRSLPDPLSIEQWRAAAATTTIGCQTTREGGGR